MPGFDPVRAAKVARVTTLIEQRSSITAPADGLERVASPAGTPSRSYLSRSIGAVRFAPVPHKFLALLLVLFVAKGVAITFIHAPYTGHDEVAHYAYLQMVAIEHRVPTLPDLQAWRAFYEREGEFSHDQLPPAFWDYCRFTTLDWDPGCKGADRNPSAIYAMILGGQYFPTGWIYTANHPPLYYLIMTPLYWLTGGLSIEGQLYALRLAAIPFGLLTVVFAFLTVRTLFPRDRFLAVTVPAFVAFQPQISYEAAMLNNDILAIAFTSGVIWLLVKGLKTGFPIGTVALIGFGYGLAVLSKNTSLTTGGIIAFAMIAGIGPRHWRQWLPRGVLAASITALMIWPWYLFMYRTYGDFTGLARIRELQYWNYTSGNLPTVWSQLTSLQFFWMRWRETWGEFGWRRIPLGQIGEWPLLRALLWITIVAMIGIAVWAARFYLVDRTIRRAGDEADARAIARRSESVFVLDNWQVMGVLTMGVTCILAYGAILQFGTTFSLTQARYYFPAIVPASILAMLGLRALLPRRWLSYGQAGIFGSLVVLTVIIYSAYVIPYWSSADQLYRDIDPFFR